MIDTKKVALVQESIDYIKRFLKYDELKKDLNDLNSQIESDEFWNNPEMAAKLLKKKEQILNSLNQAENLAAKLEEIKDLYELGEAERDNDILAEVNTELDILVNQAENEKIDAMLNDKHDILNCFIEINAGAGGTEAQDWAEMLARMYSRWAENRKYKVQITDQNIGEEAGLKSVTLQIIGHKAYGWLKHESGIHRLVRISPFDSNARRHTSFASVLVTPELDNSIDIIINESDLRIDVYRASGAGGQHVNKTESAVRITHLPSGIVTSSQIDRSQHRNKEIALKMLKAKLYAKKLQEQQEAANASVNKTTISWGNQIRSYVLQPYQMVKDLRTGVENTNTRAVLDGDIDMFLWGADL